MKKLFVLSVIATLSINGLNAKNSKAPQQTKPTVAAKNTNTAKKPVTGSKAQAKVVFMDFELNDGAADMKASRKLFITELLKGVQQKSITAYDAWKIPSAPGDEIFSKPITYQALVQNLSDTVLVDLIDKDGNKTGTKKMLNAFTADRVFGYRIKEEMLTDAKTGVTKTSIVAIAPAIPLVLSNGDTLSTRRPICWVKYAPSKKVLEVKKFTPAAWNALFAGGKVKTEGF